MLRWIGDSLEFLLWLGVLQLARLVVVLFCIAEIVGVLTLWVVAFIEWQTHDRPIYLLMPLGATLFVAVQVALWQFTWLRMAQRGGHWRAIAEVYAYLKPTRSCGSKVATTFDQNVTCTNLNLLAFTLPSLLNTNKVRHPDQYG